MLCFGMPDKAQRIVQHMQQNTRKQAFSGVEHRTEAEAGAASKQHLNQCFPDRSAVSNIHQMSDAEAQRSNPEAVSRVLPCDCAEQNAAEEAAEDTEKKAETVDSVETEPSKVEKEEGNEEKNS